MSSETSHLTPMEEYMKWAKPFWNTAFWDDLGLYEDPEENKDILIVEDDSDTIKLFKALIKKSDETVRIKSVSSAEEAEKHLDYLRKNQLSGPFAAMIDYNLTGKNGLYVCHLLETYFPQTKVIVVSGLNPMEISKMLEEQDLKVEFMPKPINRGQIAYILRP